jgi:hypothetical protein
MRQAVDSPVGFACKRIFYQLCRYVSGSINMAHLFTHAPIHLPAHGLGKKPYTEPALGTVEYGAKTLSVNLAFPVVLNKFYYSHI